MLARMIENVRKFYASTEGDHRWESNGPKYETRVLHMQKTYSFENPVLAFR